MQINILDTKDALGISATNGASSIQWALADRGEANIVIATGASQLEMITYLVQAKDIRWDRVTVFHLDE